MAIFIGQVNSAINIRPTYGFYNLRSVTASTWIEIVILILYSMYVKPDIRFIEMPSELRNKYQCNILANIPKLRSIGCEGKIAPLKDAAID